MSTALRIILICAVLFVLLELKNRRERPYYQKLEAANAKLLEGCFLKDPINRRRFMRALAHFANGRMTTAQAMFISTARRVRAAEDEAACLYMASKALSNTENDYYALECAEKAVKLQPEKKHIRMEYARMLARNRNERALEEFKLLLDDYPDDPLLYHSYGNACILLDAPKEAIPLLETALQYNPDFNGTCGLIMLAYAMQGEREKAAYWCKEAVKHGEDEEQLREIMEDMLNKNK